MTAEHGTRNKYQRGCRCAACTEGNRVHLAAYRATERGGEVVRRTNADASRLRQACLEYVRDNHPRTFARLQIESRGKLEV